MWTYSSLDGPFLNPFSCTIKVYVNWVEDFRTEVCKSFHEGVSGCPNGPMKIYLCIDKFNNLVFWCRFLNKLETLHTVYATKTKHSILNLIDRHQFPW